MLKRLLQIGGLLGSLLAVTTWLRWRQIQSSRVPAPLAHTLIDNPDKTLSVERVDDMLTIAWEKPTTRTTIYLAETPETINHDKPAAIINNRQEAVLQGVHPTTRYYVEIVFEDGTTVGQWERVLPLASVPNFRDIGGYETRDGKRVRWHQVFRASALDRVSAEDAQTLEAMNIQLVCDVRTTEEHLAHPDNLPDSMTVISTPPSSDDNVWMQLIRLLFVPGFLENILSDLYKRVMIDDNPQVFKEIFERLADPANLPTVIHCAAGKDRTGIVTALLLSVLGVPDETIIADYTLSNHEYAHFKESTRKSLAQLRIVGLTEADFDYLLIADGELMRETLAYVRQTYGSVENYLVTYTGITSETIEAIRENLLA
ncbi:MAG: tyrosine-protein phosphatase [Chloroflexota bacterium]